MNKRIMLSIALVAFVMLLPVGCKKKPPVTDPVQDTVEVKDTTPVVKDTVEKVNWDSVKTDIIVPVENVDSLILANLTTVIFGLDSYELSDAAMDQVITAARFLNEKNTIRIRLDGHCDERGSSEYNMGLGEKRALAVRKLLVDYEVDARRIETTSFGKEQPVTPGCMDDDCHSQNRRVEFTVISK